MSLAPPEKLQKSRATLHAKAKASPNERFHALYDKVYRSDVLAHAYACCNAHVRYRLRKWWGVKHKTQKSGPCWYWSPWLAQIFGLLQLRWDSSRLPHASA